MILVTPRRWAEDSDAGFVVRFAAIAIAVVVVAFLVAAVRLPGPLSFAAPAAGALVLAVAYLRRPAEALLTLAVVVLFYGTLAYYSPGPIKQLDEIAMALVGVVAFVRAAPSWRGWMWWPRELALAVLLGVALISTALNDVPVTIWLPALFLAAKAIAFLYVVMWTEVRRWEIAGGMRVVLGIGIAMLVTGFIEMLVPAGFQAVFGLPSFQPRGGMPVVKSVFVHPAIFGWFTTFVALFLFAAFLTTRRWLWLALGLAFSLGPILSARRRAILSLAAGLGAAFVEMLRTRPDPWTVVRAWWPIAAGVGVLFVAFLPLFAGLYQYTVDRYIPDPPAPSPGVIGDPTLVDSDENPQARVALYLGSIDIAVDHLPLGAGLGRYASWMSRVEYSPLYEEYGLSTIPGLRPSNPRYVTDTFWPQILGETGVVGVAAYVAFLGSLAVMLWRQAGRPSDPLIRTVRLGAGMVFTQAVVESFANAMFHSPPRIYLVFLVVGLVASMAWRDALAIADDDQQA